MLEVFIAPKQFFGRLRERPVWLLPVLLVLVTNLAAVAVSTVFVDWTAQRERAVAAMQERGMTPEQIEAALERMDRFVNSPLARWGLPLAGALVSGLAGVLVLALVYNLALPLLGGSSNYRLTFAVTVWSGLPLVLGALVRIVLVLLRRSAEVSTSLLALVPGLKTGFWAALLGQADLFAFWQLGLCAIGLKTVFGLRGARAWLLVFGVWLALAVVFALLGAGAGQH